MTKKAVTQSPSQLAPVYIVPIPPETLDFPSAIREVLAGKQLTKLDWRDSQTVMQLSNNRLQICLPKNNFIPCDLIISDNDMKGTDWVVV